MTETRRLRALIADWREKAEAAMQIALQAEADHDTSGNSFAFRKEWRVRHEQADDLAALLSEPQAAPAPQEDDLRLRNLPRFIAGGTDFHLWRDDIPDATAYQPHANETYVKWSDLEPAIRWAESELRRAEAIAQINTMAAASHVLPAPPEGKKPFKRLLGTIPAEESDEVFDKACRELREIPAAPPEADKEWEPFAPTETDRSTTNSGDVGGSRTDR